MNKRWNDANPYFANQNQSKAEYRHLTKTQKRYKVDVVMFDAICNCRNCSQSREEKKELHKQQIRQEIKEFKKICKLSKMKGAHLNRICNTCKLCSFWNNNLDH